MAYEDREQFRILFLDKKNQMIADEVQQTGTPRPTIIAWSTSRRGWSRTA